MDTISSKDYESAVEKISLREPGQVLYEPDPAVFRAGLVRPLAVRLNAAQLDPDIAYLTSDILVDTPYAKAYQVEDWLPFNLKRLRSYLRQRGILSSRCKESGSPIRTEDTDSSLAPRARKGQIV